MRFLLATDGSPGAAVALDFLLDLPLSCADEVTVACAQAGDQHGAALLLERCSERFAERGIRTSIVLRAGGAPDVVVALALERAIDLVVMGSRGLGALSGVLMGSVARAVVGTAPAPVLVVRARHDAPQHAFVAVDGSAEAHAAIELMTHLPLPNAMRFSLLHVIADDHDLPAAHPGASDDEVRAALRIAEEREGLRLLAHARTTLSSRVVEELSVERGDLQEHVLRGAINAQSDLIVLGTRGQTQRSGLLGTSVADHVLGHAHCAVLVAKPQLRSLTVAAPAAARAVGAV